MDRDPLLLIPETQNIRENPVVPEVALDRFENEKGLILNLARSIEGGRPIQQIGHVAVLFSKPGTRRADHWHKTDWHYAFVVSGLMKYRWREIRVPGSYEDAGPARIREALIGPGAMFFTPPQMEHAMLFEEPTVIITVANRLRTHEDHEADLVRLESPL